MDFTPRLVSTSAMVPAKYRKQLLAYANKLRSHHYRELYESQDFEARRFLAAKNIPSMSEYADLSEEQLTQFEGAMAHCVDLMDIMKPYRFVNDETSINVCAEIVVQLYELDAKIKMVLHDL